ncbi:MAG: hypothetical protein MPN21_21845 [Thermoanaerobaculia bacterium]|nr:hypothetical protein [Thermoanaerobaculia bacterium]
MTSRSEPARALPRLTFLTCLLGLLLLPLASFAEEASDSARSKTVAGLLELLQADMTEDVILLWLETQPPATPQAEDLVALRDAGASDQILTKLLSLDTATTAAAGESEPNEATLSSSDGPTAEATAPPAAASPSSVSEAPSSPPEGLTSVAVAAPSTPTATGDTVVNFTLSYLPEFQPDEKDWDLYVYLDGKPLAYVSRGSRVLGGDSLQFEQALEPGRHQIRIVQENHELGEGGSYVDDSHEARISPVDLVFQLQPGDAEVEIRFKRPLLEFRSTGPIHYRIAQGGRVLLAEEGAGGDPDSWTPLCDDAEVAGLEPPRACRDWAGFWVVDAPPRHDVIRALSLFDYRPVPKNQKVH